MKNKRQNWANTYAYKEHGISKGAKTPSLYSEIMNREFHKPQEGDQDKYRDGWERVFGKKEDPPNDD